MEDALFNTLLFVGFYCLYSAMFAPNTTRQPVTVVANAAVQQPTETVKTEAANVSASVTKPIAVIGIEPARVAVATAAATVEHSTPILQSNLEPDRDFTDQSDTAPTTTAPGFTSTASLAKRPKSTTAKSSQLRKQTAIASGKGSKSRH